ncbi:MAG: hypothetical protein IJ484_02695, partial [Oscillospiraceae bacterium]|nr:hypothetical protein [Oscillospiraceae bacterium]
AEAPAAPVQSKPAPAPQPEPAPAPAAKPAPVAEKPVQGEPDPAGEATGDTVRLDQLGGHREGRREWTDTSAWDPDETGRRARERAAAVPPTDDCPTGEILLDLEDQGEFSTMAQISDEFATFFTTPVMEQEEHTWTMSGFLGRGKKKKPEPHEETATGEVVLEPAGETIDLGGFEQKPQPRAEQPAAPAGDDEPTRLVEDEELEEMPAPEKKSPFLRLFGREEPEDEPFTEPAEGAEPAEPALEYSALGDAPAVSEMLAKGNARLTLTTALCGLLCLVMLYLGITASGVIAPISALDPTIAPGAFLGVQLTLLAVACLLAGPVMVRGLKGLGKREPSPDTLPALAALGALVQVLVFFFMVEDYEPERMTLFAPLAVLSLTGALAGHRVMGESVERNFELVSSGVEHSAAYRLQNMDLTTSLAQGLGEEKPCLLVSRPTARVKDFLKRSNSRRRGDGLARKLALALAGVAVLAMVIALARGKSALAAVSALAGTLCLGAPLAVTLVPGVTSWMQQKASARVGAVVPGWASMEELSRINTIVTEGHDLFPAGTVTLHGLKTFSKERIDLAILYAASVLVEGCDTLRDLFLEIIQGRTEILYKVESLTCEPGRGFTAWVDGQRIVIGGRAMMAAYQIGMPSRDMEERYTHGKLQPVYLAVSGKLFGMFVVGYKGNREIASSLRTLQKSGLSLLVRTDDFSLTGELIERAYRLRRGTVKVLTDLETEQLASATGYLPESEGCMVHLGSLASYVGGLYSAVSAIAAENSADLVVAASVAASAVMALVLSLSGGLAGLALPAVVLYQLAWCVPALALPLTRKY